MIFPVYIVSVVFFKVKRKEREQKEKETKKLKSAKESVKKRGEEELPWKRHH